MMGHYWMMQIGQFIFGRRLIDIAPFYNQVILTRLSTLFYKESYQPCPLTIGSPRDNVKTLLSCIADTCKWSHGTFGKTRVTRHGVSYTVFEAYLDTEELSKIVVCIDFYSTHRAASAQCEPRQIVGSLLAAVEQFWTCTVPSNVREMLQIKYNSVDAALDGVYPVQSIPGTQLRAAILAEGSRPNVRL